MAGSQHALTLKLGLWLRWVRASVDFGLYFFLVCFIVSLIFWCMFVVLGSVLTALSLVIGGGNDYIPLLSGM